MAETMEAPRVRAFRPEMAGEVGSNTRTPGWDLATERRIDDGKSLADLLGWLSIGLGAVELLAPHKLERWLGMENRATLIQAFGARGIIKGAGILANRRPTGWVWARAVGDALDLAVLAAAMTPDNPRRQNVALAMGAMAGVAALDVLAAVQLSRPRRGQG